MLLLPRITVRLSRRRSHFAVERAAATALDRNYISTAISVNELSHRPNTYPSHSTPLSTQTRINTTTNMLRLSHTHTPASSADGHPSIGISGGGGSSASSSGQTQELQQALPTSVRGAAPELRRLIRKRQNSESAKRCRQRKKIEDARAADELVAQAARLRRLEALVGAMCARLEATQNALATLCARAGVCTRCTGNGCSSCTAAHQPVPNQNSSQTPYSPQSVQGADASALAAKVDEIAGWN